MKDIVISVENVAPDQFEELAIDKISHDREFIEKIGSKVDEFTKILDENVPESVIEEVSKCVSYEKSSRLALRLNQLSDELRWEIESEIERETSWFAEELLGEMGTVD